MMRDMRVYVQDMIESVEVIGEYIQSLTEEEFYRNRQVQDAVLRRLEIIGEAVNPVRNSSRCDSKPSGALNPAGIILKSNPAAEQRGIISNGVKNIDEDFRNRYAEIPWKKIAGLRDVLIHEYFGVNMKRVWRVIKIDLPALKSKISKIWEDIS